VKKRAGEKYINRLKREAEKQNEEKVGKDNKKAIEK